MIENAQPGNYILKQTNLIAHVLQVGGKLMAETKVISLLF